MDGGLFILGSYLGITGIVLLGGAIFCWAANRFAKLVEIALADIGSMLVTMHSDRRSEHYSLAPDLSNRLTTALCHQRLSTSEDYLCEIRTTKIYLVRWAKRLAAASTPIIGIAALIFGYLAFS